MSLYATFEENKKRLFFFLIILYSIWQGYAFFLSFLTRIRQAQEIVVGTVRG